MPDFTIPAGGFTSRRSGFSLYRPERPVPEDVKRGLKSIRDGLHMRFNHKAVLVKPGMLDGANIYPPKYDGRWEVWDFDPHGARYMVMSWETKDGEFKTCDMRVVLWMRYINPERFGGDPEKMLAELLDKRVEIAAQLSEKDEEDFFETAGRWADYLATPKSGAALSYRGARMKSAGVL